MEKFVKHKDFGKIMTEREVKNAAYRKQIEQYEADIADYQKQMDAKLAEEDVDGYAKIHAKVDELRLKIDAINAIIEKAGAGFSEQDVIDEWEIRRNDCENELSSMRKSIEKKRKELLDLMIKASKVSCKYNDVRGEMFRYYKVCGADADEARRALKDVPAAFEWDNYSQCFFHKELHEMGKVGVIAGSYNCDLTNFFCGTGSAEYFD